jgi:hypothetical protein
MDNELSHPADSSALVGPPTGKCVTGESAINMDTDIGRVGADWKI